MNFKAAVVHNLWLPSTLRRRWLSDVEDARFQRELAEARSSNEPDAVQLLRQQRLAGDHFSYEEDEIAFTKHFSARARQMRVPMPVYPAQQEENESWSYSYSLGERYLTAKGVVEVRDAIRKEQRWKVEQRAHWIAWFSACTGFIGALIGLVALLKHK